MDTSNLNVGDSCVSLSLWDTVCNTEYDRLRPLAYPKTVSIDTSVCIYGNKGNNNITEHRAIFQRQRQNSQVHKQTKSVNNRKAQCQ